MSHDSTTRRREEGPASTGQWVPGRFEDVIAPVLDALPGRESLVGPVCHIHAPAGVGAGLVVRGWLHRHGLDHDLVWHEFTREAPTSATRPRAAQLAVISGVNVPFRELDLPALTERYRSIVLIGSATPDPRDEIHAPTYPGRVLALTADGVRSVAAGRGFELSEDQVSELMRQTGGWPRLVDAVLGAYLAGEDVGDLAVGLSEALPDVAEQIIAPLADDLAATIRLMALAGETSMSELSAFGPGTVRAAASLRRMGLAQSVTMDGHPAYRLLTAVARAAVPDVGRGTAADPTRDLLLQLSRRREAAGIGDRGLGFAYQARDWDRCSMLIDKWWPELSFQRDVMVMYRVELALPVRDRQAWPGTWHRAEYRGLAPLGEAPVRVPATPEQARAAWTAGAAELHLKRVLMAIIARRVHHQYLAARELVERARHLWELNLQPVQGAKMGVACFWFLHAAVTCDLVGDFDAGQEMLRAGWLHRAHDSTEMMRVDLASKLAAHAAWRGHADEARVWRTRGGLDALETESWFRDAVMLGFLQAEILLADDLLDRDTARRAYARLSHVVGTDELWPARLAVQVHHLLTWGGAQEAHDIIVAARERRTAALASDGIHATILNQLLADVELALGRGTQARRSLRGLGGSAVARLIEARLLLLSGRGDQAADRCELLLHQEHTRRQRSELLVLRAVAVHRSASPQPAAGLMTEAVEHVVRHDHLRALCTVPRAALDELSPWVAGLDTLLARIDARGGRAIYPAEVALIELTERERVVLNLLAEGKTLRETSAILFVSMNTVKTQVRSLYARLGVSGRREAVAEAARLGLLDP